ncbi:protein OBERON 3-like [Bidens hawaiensis]|uniref:protein OBERON 3-like n=1 Tax=Bidens hawaiensis TaxID=980011 RepID=UPI00404A5600
MLKDLENDAVNDESNQNPPPISNNNPDSKLGISQELTLSYLCDNNNNSKLGQNPPALDPKLKGKSIASEDLNNNNNNNQDDNRWVERDFLQLSENSSKREIQDADDDESFQNRGDKKPKLETLDLSLALPETSMSLATSNRLLDRDPSLSLKPSRSLQSLARSNSNNTQTTFSNDFSMSCSYSHQFSHNPSCSMTRNSTDNFENSKRDYDQIWNAGEGTNGSVHSRFRPAGDGGVALVQANRSSSENNLSFFPSELPARMKTDAQSGDSRGRGSESLDFGRSRRVSRPERILREVVSESIQTMALITQELPEETFESTKEYLKKLITVPEKRDELVGLQLRLERRSDLTSETLSKANRNQVMLLVSIRTGLETFLSAQNRLPTNELTEIFLNERCKNVNCKRLLPVEDCDCKICSTKKGFCSECMCPVCLNFDCASNTCSWVGCDVCSHWCHAACSIQKNLIKPGPSLKGPTGTTEMQFNCLCCGHASEIFGFIKDVFKSCAEQWGLETLIKELDCVRKIFRGSGDYKGQKLNLMVGEMIMKLQSKVMSPSDVCMTILQFFNTIDLHAPPEFPISNSPLNDLVSPPKPHQTSLYNTGSSSGMMNTNKMIIDDEWSVKSSKKDAFDSVESLVRIKDAEARMFQNKADEARREAEGYKRMIWSKIEKLDEEYTEKISKLNLHEIEEERKKKAEEVNVSENDHCEYYKMKMRMQAEIAGLLERMEKTKQQWV